MSDLTTKQNAFVTYYMAGEGPAHAAKHAGYTGTIPTLYGTGGKLVRNPKIIAEIATRQASEATAEGIDLATIVRGLHDNALNAALEHQFAASTGAWVAMGKALGLIVDRHEIKTTRISADVTKILDERMK